jgi:glycosyltransferase involved in cell wall biosynthesis
MKLLVAGIEHPQDIKSWSGIPYHLSRSLAKRFDLCFVGGLEGPMASLHRRCEIVYAKLHWGDYRIRSEPGVLKEFARRLDSMIAREKPNAILSISCEPIAYLRPGLPAYLIHDATFRLLSESYSYFQHLSKRSKKTGDDVQKRGFARATTAFPSSEWARQSACEDYGVLPSRVKVLPMGANLIDPPSMGEVAEAIETRLRSKEVQFLFAGVEWLRKGGDSAVSIVQGLVERGVSAKLHIVGCTPPAAVLEKPFVRAHGFLSKNDSAQAAKLRNLFKTANFFILPSIAECFGCVFCEANAFGVPCISRATGGIPEIIKPGQTGFLISVETSEEQICDLVFNLNSNPQNYREMAQRARSEYEDRLNWDTYTRRLEEIINVHATAHAGGTRTITSLPA